MTERAPIPERAPPVQDWSAAPERSNALALKVMSWIALAGGRRAARAVLHPITAYFLLTSPALRRHLSRYLGRALGRPAGWRDLYRQCHAFAATVLDRVYLLRDRFDLFDLRVEGGEALQKLYERGEGAFLVGAHLGSFEALRSAGRCAGSPPIAMLMYPDNARKINEALAAIAPDAAPRIIPLGRMEAMLELRDWLDAGGLAGMLADRTLPGDAARHASSSLTVPFLGRDAVFNDGPFRLAALLRRKVFFMAGLYLGGARYEVRFLELADFTERCRDAAERDARLQAAVQCYADTLAQLCREAPYNWFNFHDFWNEDGDAG
jgi:predicted LPLAT superfamily acyltransferase